SDLGEGSRLGQSTSGEGVETSTRTISSAGEGNIEPSSSTHVTGSAGEGNTESNSPNNSDAGAEYMHNETTPSSPQIHVQDRPDIHEREETVWQPNDQRMPNIR
ncbi:hypothetical protein H0E87_020298, partial [Populus deltoides]